MYFSFSTDRYREAISSVTVSWRSPSSTRGTNRGQAFPNTSTAGFMLFKTEEYALLLMVPSVPITPILPFFVAETAALAPALITPMMGISSDRLRASRA